MVLVIVMAGLMYYLDRITDLYLILLIVPMHEIGHYLAGKVIGIKGMKINFNLLQANVSYDLDNSNALKPIDATYYYLSGLVVTLAMSFIYPFMFRDNAYYATLCCLIVIFTNLMPFFDGSDGHSIVSIMAKGNQSKFKSLCYFFMFYGAIAGSLIVTIPKMSILVTLPLVMSLVYYFFQAFSKLNQVEELDYITHTPVQKETVEVSRLTLMFCIAFLLHLIVLKTIGYSII